jgi:hypothetical protein
MYWYGADGNTVKVYQIDSGAFVDSFRGFQYNGCTSGGNNYGGCGEILGIAWSPDNTHIVSAHSRGDEGVYYWFADIDEDNDGYNTTDQGDGVIDASRVREVSGLIQITTDTAITAFTTTIPMLRHLTRPPSNPIHAQQYQERQPKIDLVVLMGMEMAGLMKAIFTQPTSCNGQTVTGMALVTIITLT